MNSSDQGVEDFDGQRIQQRAVSDGRQTQQVATISECDGTILQQPAVQQFLGNQLHDVGGDWTTVVRTYGEPNLKHDANAIVMDGSFQQHHHHGAIIVNKHRANADQQQQHQKASDWRSGSSSLLHAAGSNVTNAHYVEQHSEPCRTVTEGNGVPVSSGKKEEARSILVMRDPQESHPHRVAPPAAPLGEVESGEDDSDCVVVVPSSTERKVEPLKINLTRDREPIRTVIKLTPGASSTPDHFQQLSPTIRDGVPGSPKITIKPPKPPTGMVVENALIGGGGGAGSSGASSSTADHHGNNCVGYGTGLPSYSSIPKLTIKPIINPADETTASEGSSTGTGAGTGATIEQMHIIPKLLIKGSGGLDAGHGRDGAMEPHIVPKLTIRGVNNHNHHHHQQHHFAQSQLDAQTYPNESVGLGVDGESSGTGSPTPLVPKLTIKMDNHHPHLHHHHHHHHNSMRVKESVGEGGDTAAGSATSGGPIPKLHIKTNQQDGTATASINSSPSPGGNCSTSGVGSSPVLTSTEGVKVTIKPLPEPPKLPKLTIKTTGLGTVAETSDVSMVSSTSNSFSPKLLPSQVAGEQLQHHPGILSQLMQPHPASPSDQHSSISSSSIPKLTIKPMPPKDGSTNVLNCSADGGSTSQATFGTECVTATVPKLTIKPILPPAKPSGEDSGSSSETSINSLESSPISSCSSAPTSVAVTTSPQAALRMTIKVPSSAPHQQQLQHEDRSASHSSCVTGSPNATPVTRLNIKPILPPTPSSHVDPTAGESQHTAANALMTSDDGDSTPPLCEDSHKPIVIPKVTIKTLANPRGQETEILSTPKVTLKPIPKPHDDTSGSPSERHSSLANNTGHSPTTNNSASLSDGTDSPRIILKINKGSSSTTTTTSGEQLESADGGGSPVCAQPPVAGSSSILANELKRPATSSSVVAAAVGGTVTLSSSGSSSVSCASSTSVSASATSSSAGSDPASPSSGGGGDQGEPGSPEVKKSKLDHSQMKLSNQQMQGVLEQQKDLLRHSMLASQYQLQLESVSNAAEQVRRSTVAPNAATIPTSVVSDVIVIDDDSKSENEASKEKDASGPQLSGVDPLSVIDGANELAARMYPSSLDEYRATAAVHTKSKRTRGTPRGARQSRRGNSRGMAASAIASAAAAAAASSVKQQQLDANAAVSQLLGLLAQDDREEGSSSDCMIVDEPTALSANVPATSSASMLRESLTLESLLRGGGSKPSAPSLSGTSGFYSVPMGSSEVEKNGTASNSSIGSVTSSVSSSVAPAAVSSTPTTAATSGRTPAVGVRMSTRRAAGQLLKEALGNKHQDRDSGVDEARTDGECAGATPSKRPRGRPKKQSVDLETNGGGSSNSADGGSGEAVGLEASGNNLLLAMAMMGSGADGRGLLGAQQLMEGIMPLPRTPARTPRTRGRGRGRGRGKLNLTDGTIYGGAEDGAATPADGNVDPLFIGTPNDIIDPTSTGMLDPTQGFQLLFNHLQTPRGASARSRGGRRGAGSRGPRTPRGGGRGAAKAALAALLAAGDTQSSNIEGSFADLAAAEKAATNQLLETLQQMPRSPNAALAVTPKPRGRGRGARGVGTPASRRKGVRGSAKAARGRKGLDLEPASPMLHTDAGAAAGAVPADGGIFMTPMAGGLDPNRPKLNIRALKTPKNEIKSSTPPSSAETTPSAGVTPSMTPVPTDGAATSGTAPGGLQVFEEDTRMSGDFNFTTPMRLLSTGDGFLQPNDESQSSYLSSTSVTQDAINQTLPGAATAAPSDDKTAAAASGTEGQKEAISGATSASNSNSGSSRRPNKGKMEVLDAHRAQFTVDLLAEYEWPPSSAGTRGADTFMIQEQIAEYLGVKSFKRKYPDLMRRPVDMEERNFILEQGLASEKMCDLGLTAVYASEILDIMCADYPEKYEEYTRYTREKHFRELSNRQRQQQEAISAVVAAAPVDRAQLAKEKAIESAANWNCSFNKERRESRRACMDLQTYVVQVPKRQELARPEGHQQATPKAQPTNYPVALVPGQFSEYYTNYTPEELACYPINTVLLDPFELQEIVSSERYRKLVAAEEARLCQDDSSSTSSDSSSGSSSSGSDSDSDDSSSDSETNSASSSGDDEASGRRRRPSSAASSSSGSSSNDNAGDEGKVRVKKQLRRLKRKGLHGGDRGKNPPEATPAATPVRRSSRTMSVLVAAAAAPPPPLPTAACKEPTDSDDSDVPLIAVKKKSNLAAATATSTAGGVPSAGGGKRMQETVTPVKRPPLNPFMCAVCMGPENKNKYNKPELFVRCTRCRRKAHPSCIGMSSVMYKRVQQYKWQCSECKLCMKCNRQPTAIDSKMVYCDQCDRGYHLACKGLRNLPEGRWHCNICTICGLCGAQTPEGHPNPHLSAQQRQQLAMVAEWTHEYGLNALTNIREHLRTLCVPCVRQRKQSQNPAKVNSETMALLNNNNTQEPRKFLPLTTVTQGVSGLRMPVAGVVPGGGVVSMKPQ